MEGGADGAGPKPAKPAANERLRNYVRDRPAGEIRCPDGTPVVGPQEPQWKGRNKPRHQDRRWAAAWSPEQISNRLKADFPDDDSMRISHEAACQALCIQGRGALKREPVACLRTGRALRVLRARSRQRASGHVTPEVMISERPAEAEDRAVPGHWEGDLIIGTGRSAIGTLVERTARFTMLLHLPRLDGYGVEPQVKNGPTPAGRGTEAVKAAITGAITTLPEQLRRSLTWDRGKEPVRHAQPASTPGCRSTSPTRTAPGNGTRTKTPTDCCASTSPRAQTCRDGMPTNSRPLLSHSTTDPAKPSVGRHLPKP
ncbi:hypothetical protein HDA32_000600 [Spinactinospora alkalitolerans]|uniref:Transposase n=1 Tax=Spinactinospora alkalitolerans TaxID=687207 RepID=A0A852TU67_9ACTN|nr:hypothetical protein [Spinactinospora alkalitolerans]